MVRSGELPVRLLALHYGADLVWGASSAAPSPILPHGSPTRTGLLTLPNPGPETVDHSLIGATRRVNPRTRMIEYTRQPSHAHSPANQHANPESVIYRLDPERERGRLVFQLGTADPERAVAAARVVAADVAGIDVNAGCPKPFSLSGGMGAALLRTPDRLAAILEALVREVTPAFGVGISVKIRLLETAPETEALVRRLVRTGITGLTVHCRTTPMRPREPAIRGQLRMIAAVCREAGVACVMNGDVEDRDQAEDLVREYGVDGAMIATAAERNPSCFRPRRLGGLAPWEEVAERYMRFALEAENRIANTKFSLTHIIPGRAPVYRTLSQCRSYVSCVEALGYKDLVEKARETDRVLGLGEFEVKPPPKQKAKQQAKADDHQQASRKRKREEDEAEGESATKADETSEASEPAPPPPPPPAPPSATTATSVAV